MSDPIAILKQLESTRAETLRRLDGLTQAQLDWRPAASAGLGENAWSLGEIFMHLAIDEHYLREQIARPLLEGIKPPDEVSYLPPPPPYGTPRPVIQFWFARARAQTRHLLEHWPASANLVLKHAGGLEPMNGAEWFAGYGGHEAFHHKQINALIVELPAFRSS